MADNPWLWWIENTWAIWVFIALILTIAELFTLDFILLMLASGALAGAITAFFAPTFYALQVIMAIVVSILMLFLIRPTLLEYIHRMPGYKSVVDKLIGSTGKVIEEVHADGGQIKIDGQMWKACSLDSNVSIPVGSVVEVYEVKGITLIVYPLDL